MGKLFVSHRGNHGRRVEHLMMRIVVAVMLWALLLTQAVAAAEVRDLGSRQGDNTIYMTWNEEQGEVKRATSSQRIRAGQKIELLTRLVDRTGRIRMRAVLRNISEHRRFRIDGRLVHKVSFDGEVVKQLETKVFNTVLGPGERIVARFSYTLGTTGEYSARTNYKRV